MRCTLWLLSLLFTAQASYQGVSNVHLEDDNDIFGMVTGTISWTLPDNMTNVVSFKPYFAVDYDSPSGNDDYTHQYGMAAGAQSNTIQEVAAPATEFHVGVTAPGYAFQRRPPWPWKGTPAEPFIYSGDAPLLVVKVLAKIGSDYQTNDQLLPQSMHVVNDVGWTGDPPLDLSFIMEEGGSSSGGVEVTFVDSDTRCGYVGGAINISVPFGVDVTMLRWARLDFAEDLQGTNALTITWVDIALSGSVPIPADLQHGSRVYLLLVGSVNDTWEVPYGAIFQDDCGGVPNVAFNMSFIDEDPLSGVISGTVRLEIARDAADEYSSMNFYLATRASSQPTWLGSIAPLQTEFVLTGVQLNSRDLLLAYLNNSYGQQVDPVVVQIQEMITAVPSSESQVLSIQFNDEDGLFGKIAGLVTWSPGSMAVTEYFAVFAAQNASGKGQVQVSPNVSADAAHEWYINASLDTSGEPYTYLLVYPGNSIGFAASALSVHFEDSRVTCRNDAFEPCPKSQVLKDEELLPYACQGERCSAQECCTDAGTCSDFLNGTSPNASNGSVGCADGYVAMQSPPEFCAGAQCQNYDCCLRTAEAMATVQTAATTWDSIQVTWSVPSLNNCTFQEYQVQLLAENSSNSTWQDVTSCELKDSCGSSCLATGLRPSSSSFRARVRVKCLLIGAHDQEFFSAWTESALSATTGQQPPNAPALIAASVRYETEVLQSWNPLDANELGPDCTFESWSVQIRELGTSVWISVTTCGATAQCLIQNLKCNTDYEVRVAAICQGQTLMGEYSYSSFSTTTGEKCLRPAQSPSNVAVTVVGTSNVTVMWTPGDAMECIFDSWLVQFRVMDAATWQSQGCSSLRSDALCTVEGLGSATSYEIRIQETCNVSSTNSEWSNVTFATTLGLPADVSGLTVEVLSYDSVQLSWSLPTLNDCIFSQYHLQRAVAGTSAWQDVICQASSVCDTSCRVSALPSNTAWTFHVRTLCGNDQVLNSDWSDASLPMSTWPRPAAEVELRSATVLSHDVVVLTWLRPTTNDCILQGYQVELYDGAWRADPSGCATVSQSATGCTLTNLACDTEFQARVIARCSDPLANSGTGNATVFRTTAGAECLKSATLPRGLLLISGSVGQLTFTWEAGEANDCTFDSWDVRLNTSDGQSAASCHNSARNLTSCTFSNLAENSTYLASVQEICSQSLLSSLIAGSLPATTLSVPVPSVVLQLPFPNEPVSSRPSELTVMYDVDVEFPAGGPLPQVCAQAPCSGCTPQEVPSVRNFRLLSWAQNSSFWQQGCSYDVSLPLGFVVTRQQPGKSSPISQWSFTFRVPDPQILHLAQVLQVSTESATVSIAWDSSVEFRCRVASLETVWQLAPREVSSFVDFTGLLPETRYDIECMARLQDEPSVVSSWLSAGQLQTEKDFNVELEELYLHVQPLCLSHSMESYELPVTPTLQSNRTNYSVALPNADFALNCTQQEATWQLELRTKAQSQYARTEVTTDNGTTDVLMLTLPAEEVLVTSSFSVTVTAGCGCAVESYHVQVMGLRLSFHVGLPSVTKATGDAVPLNQTEEGHRLQVSVSYDNDALPSSLWNSLSIYLGPFQQVTLAAPAESQTASQVYTLMTTLSAVGKDLPLQLRLAGALVGQSSSNVSFAAPFVNCISTVGYGQCTAEELEKKEVFVRTLGETMLYVKGQGFGNHEALPGSDLMRISVTQSFNITELCEASGFVSNTEMWCRLVPKGASPLEMWLLGPMESAELLQVPWSIRYEAPLIENFSQPVLKIMDGGQLYIIGQNFPDFQDDGGTVGFEANGSRRLRALEGISTSEVCTSLTRVNQTHLLCDMKSRIDLTRARCTDVDIVVAWGDLTTEMGTVPLRLNSPQITGVSDATPNRKGRAVEVGSFFYRLGGVGFGTTENGRIQVLVGNRSCEVSSRNDTQIFCQMTGPLRDDLSSLYPETPENASDGDVDVSVVMPVWISLGSSSIESSEDCKAIAANWSSHEVYLKNCVAGSQRESTRTDECIQCQPGWFTPVAGPFLQCLGCPKASFSYSPGSTACEACPSGRTTYQNATPSALDCSCLPGRFVPLTERVAELEILERIRQGEAAHSAKHQLSSCVSCPVGASCAGGLVPPVAEPGWWLLANEVPVQCMMEGCLGNNTCRRGYNPRTRCETCMDQFYPDLEESTCNECESWVLLFGMIYSAVTFVVLFGFFFPFLSWKARVALDPAKGVAPPKLCFGLFHCCLKRYVARRQLVSAEYVDMSLYHDKVWKYTRRALQHFQCVYHSPMRRICQGADLQPVVNIIFNNLQVFFLLANIGYHSWPERFKEALNFGLLLVSSAESLRPSCVAPIGSEGRWYLIFAAPLALYLSCVLFVYFRQRDKKRCLRIILMVSGAFMLYLSPFCLLTASMVFDCVRSGANEWVWDLDRGIVCWSDPEWFRMAAVGIGGLVLLFIVLIFIAVSAYRTYHWYRTAEVGMMSPKAVFFTWWWLSGLRGLSLKHRAAIQGYKVHLDLPKDVTEASEVSSLCDDLLLQNVANLKSGIARLNDYLQGFRVDDARDSASRPWHLRGQEAFCEHCQGCGKHMHNHKHKAVHSGWFCGLCQSSAETSGVFKMRTRLRQAAYNRLTMRLEHLLLELRQMSSFSDRSQSLKDLLSFAWELITLVYKTSLGMTRLLSTQHHTLGLQVSLWLSIGYLVLVLTVWPYRHNGLNILSGFFAGLNAHIVYSLIQMEKDSDSLFWNVTAAAVTLTILVTMVLVPLFWAFFALWGAAFSENYYVMATQEVQGTLWRGPSSPKSRKNAEIEDGNDGNAPKEETGAPEGKKAYASMLTRVVGSPEELLPDEPVAAQWCFRLPLDTCARGGPSKDPSAVQHMELTLEQGIGITVRSPAMLLQILNAEGGDVDFYGKWGLPALPPCRLRRGGDLPGRLRISVPCSDQRLLRTTLKQLNALSDATHRERHASQSSPKHERDTFSVDDVMTPRSHEPSVYSTLSIFSTLEDRHESEMAPRLSTVTTNTQATQATQASVVSQKPTAAAFQMKALTKAVKIGGRIVPQGAHMDSIRYVPPGTSVEDAMVESPEEFLYRLSRSRFGKGGVLRDAHGVLVLEFQRPDDPLDVQMELAELILSRDEVPEEKPEGGVDAPPSGLRTRQKVEWARAMYTERAKALVWDVGEFVLPLDLRFTWPVPSLQLHVSPKPDWGCMQQVLVLSRGGQQWILQAQEVNYHLGLAGEVSVKRRWQALRNSSGQPNAEAQESFEMIDESDEDLDLEDEDTESLQAMTTVRTGKSSGSRGHFGSRSAWRTKSGGVVFVHDFSCFGGTLELVGRPQDIKAVEKGELLGQQVLWHPPKRTPRPSAMQRLPGTEEKGDGTCSTMSAECPEDQPMRGWFDGQNLYWEPIPKLAGAPSEPLELQSMQEALGGPKEGELPAGPWVRISSALEPGGIPGPDSGLWTLQSSFYAACYGPVPFEFLEKLGDFQAGPGARELYLRTRRDARKGKEEERERPPPEEEEVIISDESSDEDYTLEALGLVETKQKSTVAFEEIIPTLKRNSQPPRLRTLDS